MVVLGTTLREPEREIEYVAMLRAQRARSIVLVGSRTGRQRSGGIGSINVYART
jgi:LacI family transcriptional regulator